MKKGYLIIILVFSILLVIIPNAIISTIPIITVKTDSMYPTLNPGDKLVIDRYWIEELKEGDIIAFDTFSEEFGIITHRVVEVNTTDDKSEIHTKGDNNDLPDLWKIDQNSFIGIVIEVNPPLLLINDVVTYPLFAIAVISAILLIREFSKKSREIE